MAIRIYDSLTQPGLRLCFVRCRSGIWGERHLLRPVYIDFEEFLRYCEVYNIHRRLDYHTPREAWKANPVVESSVNLGDYRRIYAPVLRQQLMGKKKHATTKS